MWRRFEDYFLLMGVSNKKLFLQDKLLLQSCLKSIALASDSGDDPVKALKVKSNFQEIFFQTLGDEVEKKVVVINRRFQISDSHAK